MEPIRFSADLSMGFSASDIAAIRRSGESDGFEMMVTFLGLHGVASPLPAHYAESALAFDSEDNPRRDFLDFFHHRLISLFYRSWEKYRYYVQYRSGGIDPFSSRMFALVGLFSAEQRAHAGLDWSRLLSYIGLLATRSRSADTVSGVIGHCFALASVQVIQYQRRHVIIEQRQRNRLGLANGTLGKDFYLGVRVPDIAGKFALVLSGLDFDRFLQLLPSGRDYPPLVRLIEFMLRDQLAYDLILSLRRAEVPSFRLGGGSVVRLGWSTWIGFPDANDQVVRLSVTR